MSDEALAIECDLTVLADGERERLTELSEKLFPRAREVRDLPGGYALGYHDVSPELFSELAHFIALHRLCCAFLRHSVVSDAGPGTVWFELTGGQGAKEAIASDLARLLSNEVAAAAGLSAAGPGITVRG
jgi:hypothetical protein